MKADTARLQAYGPQALTCSKCRLPLLDGQEIGSYGHSAGMRIFRHKNCGKTAAAKGK